MQTRTLFPLLFLLLTHEAWAEDPFTFRGDRLTSTFTTGQERTILTGNARIVSGNLEIEAETIELWGKGFRYATCTGRVTVKDTKKNLTLKADTMDYDRTLKTSRFQGLCELADPGHGVTVRAGLFDYNEASEKMNLQSGVRIFKGDLVCRSEFGVYDRGVDTLELTGLPSVNKKRDLYKAGSIRVNLKTEDVILGGGVSGTITPETKKKPQEPPQP
jgi:lipopolysaccharide export system protein LptA